MRIALKLATRAEGMTSPNPIVGACVVKAGKIVGKGFHEMAGLPHAEALALREAGPLAKGATLYVTLEPCDHFGRTPPCTMAIIKSGVRKVVIGMRDPNPLNNGRGIERLRRHGLTTIAGILEEEARSINRPDCKFSLEKMPYVTVKVAQSLDGKIATRTGDSRWISSNDSRRYVHKLRSKVDAVMVGVDTLLRDDPRLTARGPKGKDPARVIVDSNLRTPLNAKVFSCRARSPLIIAATGGAPVRKKTALEKRGAEVLIVKSREGRVDLRDLLRKLARREITHALVEGGGELIAGLVAEKLVDRFLFFVAPKIIGGRDAPTAVEGRGVAKVREALSVKNLKVQEFSNDLLIEAEAG